MKLYVLLGLILNGLYLIFYETKYIPPEVSIPILLVFVFFLVVMFSENVAYLSILAVAIICIDLYLNPVSYLPASTAFYPKAFYGRNRLTDFLETTYGKYRLSFDFEDYSQERRNLGDVYNIQTKFGYGATFNKTYLDFLRSGRRSDAAIDDLLNVRYIITDKTLDSGFVFKDSAGSQKLYERRNYYPRIYWKRQLGERGADIEIENKNSVRQVVYSDLYQKIEVNCSIPDTLILSENYYPGWKCYDNQKEIKIYPISIYDHPPLFRSITLDKGTHVIEFKYNKVFYFF